MQRLLLYSSMICRHLSQRSLCRVRVPISPNQPWLCRKSHNSSDQNLNQEEKNLGTPPKRIHIKGKSYEIDEWMNTPAAILSATSRRLHLQPDHPLAITRKLIESRFPGFKTHNDLFPVVTTAQNFDSLGFPIDHIGRSKTDTYYLNSSTVLRTHTSAHQADTFRANQSDGYLITADVYRRDAVDRSHYPVFHQMEGARTWDKLAIEKKGHNLAEVIWHDVAKIPKHSINVDDPNPTIHPERNPLQPKHSAEEVEAMAAHLKRTLEDMVVTIFNAAKRATNAEPKVNDEPLKVRWVEAYFPFTSPSWELEVFWQGDWLEVLGSGIVAQNILNNASVSNRVGWAFGLGLERIAMLLYSIPDIRLFWSTDTRFSSQFSGKQAISRFVPFSKYPPCFKDVSFWLQSKSNAAGGASPPPLPGSTTAQSPITVPSSSASGAGTHNAIIMPTSRLSSHSGSTGPAIPVPASDSASNPPLVSTTVPLSWGSFHENDVMEIAREVGGDLIEDVRLIDEFVHAQTRRRSMCYRINYRSLERTLTNDETNQLHERLRRVLVERLGVELR